MIALLISACLLQLDHNLIGPAPVSTPPVEQLMVWHADWCGPCQEMEPAVARLQREGYPVMWINLDTNPIAASRWRVEQLPTVILIHDNVEQRRHVGRLAYKALKALMRPVAKVARAITAPVRPSCPPGGCPNCPNAGNCPSQSVERIQRPSVQYCSPGYSPSPDGRCGNPNCGMCYGGRGRW